MDRFDRIYRLHGILSTRRTAIPLEQIIEELACSKATAVRCIENLRDHLNAPLEYHRDKNGYLYNQQTSCKPYELPGLWFSSEELHGLLICQQILHNISPGILSEQIESLHQRIDTMLSKENSPQPVIANKIHFASIGRRLKNDNYFKRIATALFNNQQIRIQYKARGQNQQLSERRVSPQKLMYYRDNWYIAAKCHYRKELRMFSIDSIHSAEVLEQSAEITEADILNDFLHASYGIFSGKAQHTATLEFTSTRASWVADEHWHPEQQGKWLDNGDYQLSIPFNDSRELIMDILKHGAEVKVIAPQSLQDAVMEQIEKMQKNYDNLTK